MIIGINCPKTALVTESKSYLEEGRETERKGTKHALYFLRFYEQGCMSEYNETFLNM